MTPSPATGCDHENNDLVLVAAQWLASNRAGLSQPIVPALQERFQLTTDEAIEAACLAWRFEFLGGDSCAS